VDNNSTDNSVNIIKDNYKKALLLESPINLGFSKGNNYGVKHANGSFILLLNNDTILKSDLKQSIDLMQNEKTIGLMGARMIGADGEYRHSAGRFPSPQRIAMISKMLEKRGFFNTGNFPQKTPRNGYHVDFVEGSFMLIKKNLWDEINGFDENFFMYGEDVDLCYRLRKSGYHVIYNPHVEYIHFSGFNPKRDLFIVKGILIFHRKWSSRFTLFVVQCLLLVRSVGKFISAGIKQWALNDQNSQLIASTSAKSVNLILNDLRILK
jgi:GT2 family glycosyltransferase